jgi:hypothetical protein
MIQAFCLNEHIITEMVNPVIAINTNGRPSATGDCAQCGRRTNKILTQQEYNDFRAARPLGNA